MHNCTTLATFYQGNAFVPSSMFVSLTLCSIVLSAFRLQYVAARSSLNDCTAEDPANFSFFIDCTAIFEYWWCWIWLQFSGT